MDVRRVISPAIRRNHAAHDAEEAYEEFLRWVMSRSMTWLTFAYNLFNISRMEDTEENVEQRSKQTVKEGIDYIMDLREYDVPYLARIAIDYGA